MLHETTHLVMSSKAEEDSFSVEELNVTLNITKTIAAYQQSIAKAARRKSTAVPPDTEASATPEASYPSGRKLATYGSSKKRGRSPPVTIDDVEVAAVAAPPTAADDDVPPSTADDDAVTDVTPTADLTALFSPIDVAASQAAADDGATDVTAVALYESRLQTQPSLVNDVEYVSSKQSCEESQSSKRKNANAAKRGRQRRGRSPEVAAPPPAPSPAETAQSLLDSDEDVPVFAVPIPRSQSQQTITAAEPSVVEVAPVAQDVVHVSDSDSLCSDCSDAERVKVSMADSISAQEAPARTPPKHNTTRFALGHLDAQAGNAARATSKTEKNKKQKDRKKRKKSASSSVEKRSDGKQQTTLAFSTTPGKPAGTKSQPVVVDDSDNDGDDDDDTPFESVGAPSKSLQAQMERGHQPRYEGRLIILPISITAACVKRTGAAASV
jgi:hypothetical protein